MFDLNRQIIKEDGSKAIIIDSGNMAETVKKMLPQTIPTFKSELF